MWWFLGESGSSVTRTSNALLTLLDCCRGSFNDPAGNLVATMLPTSDTGIIDSSGVFFPESILPLIWTADKKLAHLRLQGIGYVDVPLEKA